LISFWTSIALFGISTAAYLDGLILNQDALNVLGLYTFPIFGIIVAVVDVAVIWVLRAP
jgi:hypothetical protein